MRSRRLGLATCHAIAVVALLGGTLSGCGGDPPTNAPTTPAPVGLTDRDRLAGLAAAAKDKRYVATYTLTAPRRPARTVTVAVATDGTWVVAVPGGALSGLADIAVFRGSAGLFQCTLGPAVGAANTRPDLGVIVPGCVAVARLPAANDPRIPHVFTDWIDPLVDRATAISVAAVPTTTATGLSGVSGQCFSIESNSTALNPPVDPGTYCYSADGLLTGATISAGTLVLAAPASAAPPTVAMPAPLVQRAPLPITAPPPPSASPSATASAVPAR